jgi:hypothetical protein
MDARWKITDGKALLVCGYEGADKFNANRLEGAMSFEDFTAKLPSLEKSSEIIFYCA